MSNDKNKIRTFAELEKKQQHKRPQDENQESQISEWLDTFEIWFVGNWKQIVKGFCVVGVAASIGIIITSMYRSKQNQIEKDFANAVTVESIEAMLKEYPAHKCADAARFKLAGLYVKDAKYDSARKTLLDIVNGAKSELFIKGCAALNAAYLLEKSGKAEDAAGEFARIYKNMELAEDTRVEAAYSALRIYMDLEQLTLAGEAAHSIQMDRADGTGATLYGYWAAKAKRLNAKLNPGAAAAEPTVAPTAAPATTAPATI